MSEPATPDPEQQLERILSDWQPDLVGTLLFVVDGDRVLLIRKKRGHGAGRINGPGGKLEGSETPLACALRETREETGVTAIAPRLAGRFRFVDLVQPQWLGYIYVAAAHAGDAVETDEGVPLWTPVDALPLDEMWEDDRYWLPRVLDGETLEGDFLFDDSRLLAHRLRAVAELEP